MDSRSLVPHFDPLEDREPGVFTCLEAGAVHQLLFQGRPQTFHHRVVVAITRATHALLHAEHGKHLAAFATRVLHTAIRMMHETLRRISSTHCHRQRIERDLRVQRIRHAPSDNASAPCIHHACEIRKSFVGRNICNVTEPFLVWSIRSEVAFKKIWRRCERVTALRGGLRMGRPCDLTSATAASRNPGVLGTHSRYETHSFWQAQTCRWGSP